MSWEDIKDEITEIAVGTFGKAITYRPAIGGSHNINGIVTRDYVEVKLASSIPISGFRTVVDIRLSDLPAYPLPNDEVTIDAVVYEVIDAQSDGGGGARLVLKK